MDLKELKERRTQAGLTQSGLGELLGVSPETIKSWELGRNPIQKIATIAIDAVLKVIEQEQAAKARNAERQAHIQNLARESHVTRDGNVTVYDYSEETPPAIATPTECK